MGHGEENRKKSIPVRSDRDRDGSVSPVPVPRIPAPVRNTSCGRPEISPSQPILAHHHVEYILKFLTLIYSILIRPPLPQPPPRMNLSAVSTYLMVELALLFMYFNSFIKNTKIYIYLWDERSSYYYSSFHENLYLWQHCNLSVTSAPNFHMNQ